MTDYRAELQRLVKAYDDPWRWPDPHEQALFQAVEAARTALAQPEPEGVADEEIEREALKNADSDDEYRAFKSGAFFVQERISRPTIEPVPVSERPWEREGWCNAEGRCWFGAPQDGPADAGWILRMPSERLSHQAVSLPHNALSVPGAEVQL
jgi:hypothetical protein